MIINKKKAQFIKIITNFVFIILFIIFSSITFNNCSRFKSKFSETSNSISESSNSHLLANGAVTFFDLKSDQTQLHPFTLGMGFKKGDIPNSPDINVSDVQVIVKRRWNDGSVKHAIFSGQINLDSNVPKRLYVFSGKSSTNNSNLTVDDIIANHPESIVDLSGIGKISLSSLLNTPFRTFISGPEMIEAHYRSSLSGTSDIMVWFQVRLYKGGKVWIRVIVENGIVDDTMTSTNYTPSITIGDTFAFNNSGMVLNHFPHTRWMVESWHNSPVIASQKLEVLYDVNYLSNTKLVPNYWKPLPSSSTFNELSKIYLPMKGGNLTPNMGETGFQDQIGLLPKWDSLFVASGSYQAWLSVMANSSSLNSYPIIWRDQNSNKIPKPTDWPTWAIQGGTYEITFGPFTWEVAHAPSEGYLAYLISGDYWHYETMAMQAATIFLSRSSTTGSSINKLLLNQTRGTAWNLRTLSQFVGIAPEDESEILTQYQALLDNQIKYYQSILHKPGVSQIGYLYEYDLSAYAPGVSAPWQQHFFTQAIGYGSDLESLPDMTAWYEVRNWNYKGIVGILGSGIDGNFCYTKASSYNLTISSSTNGDATTWFPTWKEIMSASFPASTSCSTTLEGESGSNPALASTGYWGNLLPALAYAVDHGAVGADDAYSRLTNSSNWSAIENSGFENVPNWGIVPRKFFKKSSSNLDMPSTPEPPPTPTSIDPPLSLPIIDIPGLGWSQVPNTKLASVCASDPSPSYSTSSNCRALITAWGGAAADTKRNRLVLFGGGHADYDGNELYAYDLSMKKMIQLNDPTPLLSGATGTGTYADGRPASRHTYGGITYSEHNDKMSLFGGSIPYNGDMLREVWTLDFLKFYSNPNSALPWKKLTNDIALGVNYGGTPFSAYDPVTKLVYLIDSGNGTYSLNTDSDEIKVLNNSSSFPDYHYTMVVDPINQFVYAFGYNNVKRMSIKNGSTHEWVDILTSFGSSCNGIAAEASPGVTYDSKNKKIVAWNGGTSVYIIEPLTLNCSIKNFSGTAPGPQQDSGTFNRFSYFPTFDYFVLINHPDLDVYILKLN